MCLVAFAKMAACMGEVMLRSQTIFLTQLNKGITSAISWGKGAGERGGSPTCIVLCQIDVVQVIQPECRPPPATGFDNGLMCIHVYVYLSILQSDHRPPERLQSLKLSKCTLHDDVGLNDLKCRADKEHCTWLNTQTVACIGQKHYGVCQFQGKGGRALAAMERWSRQASTAADQLCQGSELSPVINRGHPSLPPPPGDGPRLHLYSYRCIQLQAQSFQAYPRNVTQECNGQIIDRWSLSEAETLTAKVMLY